MNSFLLSIYTRLEAIDDEYKQPLSIQSLSNINAILPNAMPEDFVFLNKLCRFDFFRYASFFNLDNEIISETLTLRKEYKLRDNYLLLAEEDPGPILMKITSSDNAEVIMCSYGDFLNICEGKPYAEEPTIFSTFADFYKFLLDEEEKIRKEEQGNK